VKLYCSNGCHDGEGKKPFKTEGFQRQPHETNCPECGARLETGMERKARKQASRNNGRLRYQSDAESRAAEEFHQIIVSLGCWAKEKREGHICAGHVEAHHVIDAQWWRREFGDLPEEKLIALVYDPVIGAPPCGGFHAAVTAKREAIYFHELDRELIEHCERLDLEYPGRGVLARLRLECPVLEPAA
jgi:hypothetical protein